MRFFSPTQKTLDSPTSNRLINTLIPLFLLAVWVLPRPTSGKGIAYRSGYASFYYACQGVVIDWHKRKLAELDSDYAELQGSLNLIQARNRAVEQGIGPSDPRYPKIEDYNPGMRKMFAEFGSEES